MVIMNFNIPRPPDYSTPPDQANNFKKACARSLWGARGDHKALQPPKTHGLQSEVAIILLLASRGSIQL